MGKQQDIVKGDLMKVILKLSIPVIMTNLIQQLYNLADVYFVGRGDKRETKENSMQLLLLAGMAGSVIALLGFVFSGNILKLLRVEGLLFQESSRYIKWVLLATPATFITLCHSAIRKAEGNTLKPMIVNLIPVIVNVILNPFFIFYLNMGITGAGIATAIARFGVAAYGLGNRIHSIFFMVAQGINATLSAIVGQNYGVGNYKRIRKAFNLSMKLSVGRNVLE